MSLHRPLDPNWRPAPMAFAWVCPNGHTSISAVSPVYSCARCHARRAEAQLAAKKAQRRRRSENLYLRLMEEAQQQLASLEEVSR